MKGREIVRELKKEGWRVLRTRGSHYRMGKGKKRVSVVDHGPREIGIGLVRAIERQTGVKLLNK